MSDVKVISLTTSQDEDDENFEAFIDQIKNENEQAIFMIQRKDGTLAVGSTYKDVKELNWDIQRLVAFGQDLIRGAI